MAMCSMISWQQFLVILGVIGGIYYGAMLILFYRKDVSRWFSSRGRRRTVPKESIDKPVEETNI